MSDTPALKPNPSLTLVRESVHATNQAVFGTGASKSGAPANQGSASDQSSAKAVQSIGQTTAIVIQDAGDMLRNISTIETTAIGAATAKWIADPTQVQYVEIIAASLVGIAVVAEIYELIGTNAANVLSKFSSPATP
jgi:hypothetical protein